jgi:hypothetical protein
MEGRTESNATKRENHGLEKASGYRQRSDCGNTHDTLDRHTVTIPSHKATGGGEGEERWIGREQAHRVLALGTLIV